MDLPAPIPAPRNPIEGGRPDPNPVPILIDCRGGICPGQDYVVVMRVVEFGHDDITMVQYFTGEAAHHARVDLVKVITQRMVKTLLPEVGRRHGVWVCHIVRDESMWGRRPEAIPWQLKLPPIALSIRAMTQGRATAYPVCSWTEELEGMHPNDAVNYIVRSSYI